MLNFQQMFDKVNGPVGQDIPPPAPVYQDVPPPVQYNFVDYVKDLTKSKVCGTEDGTHELTPLEPEDSARYAADDVADHYAKMHKGKNPLALGEPLTDDEFKRYLGLDRRSHQSRP